MLNLTIDFIIYIVVIYKIDVKISSIFINIIHLLHNSVGEFPWRSG